MRRASSRCLSGCRCFDSPGRRYSRIRKHSPSDQPYFDISVTDDTTGQTLYYIHHYSNEPGYPWSPATGDWLYVPWQPVDLDLSAAVGHSVTVQAIGADCRPCGHGGYVYLDAVESQ